MVKNGNRLTKGYACIYGLLGEEGANAGSGYVYETN